MKEMRNREKKKKKKTIRVRYKEEEVIKKQTLKLNKPTSEKKPMLGNT